MDTAQRLAAPFPINRIHWRVGARNGDKSQGIALAYIDARDVMKRLDETVGPMNWQCRYSHVTDKGVVCEIGIFAGGHWLWRANGAGDTQVEAEKGAMSDAFKRAAVMWGIGRYLYSLPNKWHPIVPAGKSHKFSDEVKKNLHKSLPNWATPEGYEELMKKKAAA